MSVFAKVKKSDNAVQEKDVLGGGYTLLETDIYPFKIEAAYVTTAASGAMALNIQMKVENQNHREIIYFTNKEGKTYYVDKKTNEERNLPGFNIANALCLLTVGKELLELDSEERVINVYSKEANGEVPTKVDMLTDLLGEEGYAAIVKQVVDKTTKDDATGEYVPTGETREENVIEKLFRGRDKMTTAEIIAQAEAPVFFNDWLAKNKGITRNKAKGLQGVKAGAPKASAAATPAAKPKSSLFS